MTIRLLDHFNRLIDTPDAVPRLRRFILDLAVRGKLVEQDPKDEPAGELLKRSEKEKSRLAKAGTIRTPKPQSPMTEEEIPFGIPKSWRWVRLGEVGAIVGGGTPPSKDASCFTEGGNGIAWLTPADLGKHSGLYVAHGARDLTEKGLSGASAQLMPTGSVLFTSRAPIGYTAIAANIITTNQGFKSVVPFLMESNRYIATYFTAFATWINGRASGTTFKEVSGKIVGNLPFPLPPLAEQHRIVAKVDELMALCDELEAAQTKREKRRDRLVAATLHGLNTNVVGRDGSPSRPDHPHPNTGGFGETALPGTFEESARFYFNHLPRLTTRPEHIHQLRQTILNLAIRGKLVPQEHTRTITADTLSRIQAEKSRLATGSRLKKDKVLAEVPDDQLPFPIPGHWEWVKVGTLSLLVEYGTSVKSNSQETGVPVLRMGDIQDGRVSLVVQKKVPRSIPDLPRLFLKHKDILYNRTNSAELVGKTGIFLGADDRYTFASYLIRIRVLEVIADAAYVNLAMNAPFFRETQILPQLQQQCGQANVNGTKLRNMLIPLPPIAEQHRIVAKVDELMALCNGVEAGLTSSSARSGKCLESIMGESLSGIATGTI